MEKHYRIVFIGAGSIGTALGNILSESLDEPVLLHSIDGEIVNDINKTNINSRVFPATRLYQKLHATTNNAYLENSEFIFLAVPSVILVNYLIGIRQHIPDSANLINLAKGFGIGSRTVPDCLVEIMPNPVFTLKGPGFAREIINRLPTGLTLGHAPQTESLKIAALFDRTPVKLDFSTDVAGVELLSILKNIYAIVIGIVDAQFNSPNLRFLLLTKAFREMRKVLLWFGGKEETMFNYCGYGDFSLTALNDLSRNRTLGLLIGKGFLTEHVSHDLVLEGKTAVNVFYSEISKKLNMENHFPLIAELYKIFSGVYDITSFVPRIIEIVDRSYPNF
jgi:glycerol-3-phosphate dehydrogenase (NAD(P)+)